MYLKLLHIYHFHYAGGPFIKDIGYPNSIVIKNVSRSLNSDYKCLITNEGGEANQTITLKVKS